MNATESTLPMLLKSRQEMLPSAAWMRKKHKGIWDQYTWREGFDNVAHFSLGLMQSGLQRGSRVCIIGDGDPHWYWAELAIQAAGGTVVPIAPEATPDDLLACFSSLGVVAVIAEDQEQVDKTLSICEGLPLIRIVTYWNHRGVERYSHPLLADFRQIIEKGRQYRETRPGSFEEKLGELRPEDTALIQYDVNTQQHRPVSHSFLMEATKAFQDTEQMTAGDEWFCTITPGSVLEQVTGLLSSLTTGMKMNFAENSFTTDQDIRELGPTTVVCPSSFWTAMVSDIAIRINQTTRTKRALYRAMLPIGRKLSNGLRIPSPASKVLQSLAEYILFRPLRARLGLGNARRVYSFEQVLDSQSYEMLSSVGLDVRQILMTESSIRCRSYCQAGDV